MSLQPHTHFDGILTSKEEKLSSGSQTGGEKDCGGSGQTVPGPDREDHDGKGPGVGEVSHSLQEREGGRGVQETQQREIL